MIYIAVNVASVDGVGAHIGIEVPDADRVVAGAGHERARGKNAFHAFFGGWIGLYAPDARRMVQE